MFIAYVLLYDLIKKKSIHFLFELVKGSGVFLPLHLYSTIRQRLLLGNSDIEIQ